MTTTDFRDRLYELYRPPSDRFTFVDVPDIQFAMIDGHAILKEKPSPRRSNGFSP